MGKPSILIKENRCICTWLEKDCPFFEPFCKSVVLLNGATTSKSSANKTFTLSFFAKKVCTLREMMEKGEGFGYDTGVLIAHNLGQQLFYLEKQGYTFAWLNLENILVVDESRFICFDLDQLKRFEKTTSVITFTEPFSLKSPFLAPEIKQLYTLPSSVDYRAVYYSLGVLICICLFNEPVASESIMHTKLYWFLLRCLEKDPERRSLLFI